MNIEKITADEFDATAVKARRQGAPKSPARIAVEALKIGEALRITDHKHGADGQCIIRTNLYKWKAGKFTISHDKKGNLLIKKVK